MEQAPQAVAEVSLQSCGVSANSSVARHMHGVTAIAVLGTKELAAAVPFARGEEQVRSR